VPTYVARYTAEQREVLAVRPGITDPASLTYSDESTLLAMFADPEYAYVEEILPRKLALSRAYLQRRTFFSDLAILARTALRLFGPPPGGEVGPHG
jgi:lipopolysaccharide/colanic/teichoic acid biosynthesis glycosyltransferase